MGVGGPGVHAAQGADVDDSAAGLAKGWEQGLGDEERGAGVNGKHGVPVSDRDVFHGLGSKAAGVIDEEIEPTETANHCGGHGGDGGGVGEVAGQSEGADAERLEFGDGSLGIARGVAIGDAEVGACTRKVKRDGAADALGCPGDEGGKAREGSLRIGAGHGWGGGVEEGGVLEEAGGVVVEEGGVVEVAG